MEIEVVDEDSIDTEALQAQIDLSMSFAQSLVSSWMEPHRLPTSSRKRDLEKELLEYMKKPPRLGVGASIPEGHQNMSREARLKGKLTGPSKRLRESEGEASAPTRRTSDDEDEDESRAGAIKKKQNLDPFDVPHGKKKKKHHAKNDVSEQGKPVLSVVQLSSQNAQDDAREPDSLVEGTQKQKGSKPGSLAQNEDFFPLQDPALKADSSTLTNIGHSPKSESRSAVTSPSQRLSESGPTSPTHNTPALRNPIHADLLKRPLLNLTGPPVNSDDDDDESDVAEAGATESPLTSPKKKKRKRRRKKKHLCHSTTTSTAAPSIDLRDLQT